MGSSSSKFKKYLHHGDEFAAMQVFQSSPELQRSLNPNLSYGEHYNHDTALHFAAKHGMKHLLRAFLSDLGGNPNKKNANNETSLHAACQLFNNKSFSAMERRAACVSFIVQWKGASTETGGREKIDLTAQDHNGNTALHVAAASGLEHCVQTLINAGSPLFVENSDKMTPCDMAVKNGHYNIAQLLESKMVFGDSLDLHNEDDLPLSIGEVDEVYCGLRTQDLQEAKDQLLVETSDMLQVPLFTAEALLRDNEWSREVLLDKWMKDAVMCCQLAGVEPPQSAFSCEEVKINSDSQLFQIPQDSICNICMLSMKESDHPSIKISCNHNFCFQCWETYLSSKILEGMQHNILCPAFNCNILVPIDVIEQLVSPDLARRYLHFDINAFVESNKSMKWCPVAGCGRAVRLPETELTSSIFEMRNSSNSKQLPLTSHAVDCGNGHFFCWECLGEAHAPSGCIQWRQWLDKVNQVRPDQISNDMKDLEDASNCLWLVSNSKPCPNCKSPIQKNEGCNHIKCSKCKFDFCWVCLEAWKKHSSATGGYFRCNRFPAASKADEKQGMLISEAVAKSQQIQELNRFLHYYTRFKNHEHSRKLEESLLTAVKHKMEVLASSIVNRKEILSEKEKNCTRFIEDALRELLKARRVLCGSYVHGFYLEDHGYNKTIFEFMQNELETVTEKLSEMIARPYLKTPRHTIMQATSLSRRKRHEFVRAVSKGLIPPETPPAFRKRKRRFPRLLVMDPTTEEDMSQVIVTSVKTLDANNTWIKDDLRLNNHSAIYEWPDCNSEGETEVSRALAVSLVGECSRDGCNKPRARNPRTQTLHEYCSLRCATNGLQVHSVSNDDSVDLIIALEMSRLQMIEDKMKRENEVTNKQNENISIAQTDSDADLNKVIELSKRQHKTDIAITTEEAAPLEEPYVDYCRTAKGNANVNYFLTPTITRQNPKMIGSNQESMFSPFEDKSFGKKEVTFFRSHRTEDGRFEISDIHETCYHSDYRDDLSLRRVRSTGDLCQKSGRKDKYGDELRYHLDSDHSSQHDDKPEDIMQTILCSPTKSNGSKKGEQYLIYEEPCGSPGISNILLDDIIASDTTDADLEVCNIFSSSETDERTSLNDKLFLYQNTSNFNAVADKIVPDSSQCQDLQPVQNPATNDDIKQSSIKKLKKTEEITLSGKNTLLRKTGDKSNLYGFSDFKVVKKSGSVESLMEEFQNTFKFFEDDQNNFLCNYSDAITSSNYSSCCSAAYKFHSVGGEFVRYCPERASTGKIRTNKYVFPSHSKRSAKSATALENLKDSEKQLNYSKGANSTHVLPSSENYVAEAQKKSPKSCRGKSLHKKDLKSSHSFKDCLCKSNPSLRIRTVKSPLVTDSSNEYETDTGIPKSPTLFISGVSISRTPEPCPSSKGKDKKSPEHKAERFSRLSNGSPSVLSSKPAAADKSKSGINFPALETETVSLEHFHFGRQIRSSSLTVPRTDEQNQSPKKNFNASCCSISTCHYDRKTASRKNGCHMSAFSCKNSASICGQSKNILVGDSIKSDEPSYVASEYFTKNAKDPIKKPLIFIRPPGQSSSQIESPDFGVKSVSEKERGKSKSASEPERQREVFRFPKSSTDGALSSVLHIQESNLSSDDFHEVLFLRNRSPKQGSKRKKKSKRERDKVKENLSKKECSEVSSAL